MIIIPGHLDSNMPRLPPVWMVRLKNDKWNTAKKNTKLVKLCNKFVNMQRQLYCCQSLEDELAINT